MSPVYFERALGGQLKIFLRAIDTSNGDRLQLTTLKTETAILWLDCGPFLHRGLHVVLPFGAGSSD